MNNYLFNWEVLSICILLLSCSEALKCYECNSYHDTDCDTLDAIKIQAGVCPSDAASCKIIRQDAPFKADSKTSATAPGSRTFRGCSNVSVKDFGSACIDRVGTDKVKIRYCLCDTDGCNEARSIRMGSIATISLLGCLVWFVNTHLI